MKSVVTGGLSHFETASHIGTTEYPVILPVVLSNKNRKTVKIKIVLNDLDLTYWMNEFKRIAESRAKAHDEMASRLRAAAGADQ